MSRRVYALALALITVFSLGDTRVRGNPLKNKNTTPNRVRIGMAETLFRGTHKDAMLALTHPFSKLILLQTGVNGRFEIVEEPVELARMVQKDELQLGILHGVDYAWMKDKFPDLKPLLLAYNQAIQLKAYILVNKESKDCCVKDLRGAKLALPARSLNHCFLYLHKAIEESGMQPEKFFGVSPTPRNTDKAIDMVVRGEAAVTVVDGVAWEIYCKRKPGCAARLRILQESDLFPTATILYKPASNDIKTVRKFYKGMIRAHKGVVGRQLLTLWRLSNFGAVPEEYETLLETVVKRYPEPFLPAEFAAPAVEANPIQNVSASK